MFFLVMQARLYVVYDEMVKSTTYFHPSSFSALSVEAYTAVASPALLGHNFIGIFCKSDVCL